MGYPDLSRAVSDVLRGLSFQGAAIRFEVGPDFPGLSLSTVERLTPASPLRLQIIFEEETLEPYQAYYDFSQPAGPNPALTLRWLIGDNIVQVCLDSMRRKACYAT